MLIYKTNLGYSSIMFFLVHYKLLLIGGMPVLVHKRLHLLFIDPECCFYKMVQQRNDSNNQATYRPRL